MYRMFSSTVKSEYRLKLCVRYPVWERSSRAGRPKISALPAPSACFPPRAGFCHKHEFKNVCL